MAKKERELVWVSWVDSTGFSGWRDEKEMKKTIQEDTMECQTVGWVVDEDKKSLALTQSIAKTGQVDHVMKIPKVAIGKRMTIRDA